MVVESAIVGLPLVVRCVEHNLFTIQLPLSIAAAVECWRGTRFRAVANVIVHTRYETTGAIYWSQ
jgi:hypothetical protein